MRRERASKRVERDLTEVMDEIVSEVAPDGIKRFPDDFGNGLTKDEKLPVPASGLEVISAPRKKNQADIFSGGAIYKVEADNRYSADFSDLETVTFVYLSQDGTERDVLAPKDMVDKAKMIAEYWGYVETVKADLERAVRERVLDGRMVRGIVKRLLESSGLFVEPLAI